MMSDVIAQIARAAAELEAELRALLQLEQDAPPSLRDDLDVLPCLLVERFPQLCDERAELRGLLKIGRAARRSEHLSPAVAAAALAMVAEFRAIIARLSARPVVIGV
jgi:hypothetical protein